MLVTGSIRRNWQAPWRGSERMFYFWAWKTLMTGEAPLLNSIRVSNGPSCPAAQTPDCCRFEAAFPWSEHGFPPNLTDK